MVARQPIPSPRTIGDLDRSRAVYAACLARGDDPATALTAALEAAIKAENAACIALVES